MTILLTEAIEDEILERLMNGESMITICRDDHLPSRWTVMRWLEEYPDFATKHARAREYQGDFMDHKVLEAAENATPATAALARVQIDAYKWRASKLAPKKYGDWQQLEHSRSDGILRIVIENDPDADNDKIDQSPKEVGESCDED